MKIIMFLFVLSFYCLGLDVPNVPKYIEGAIIHHSNSESVFKLEVKDKGDCKVGDYVISCKDGDTIATIGNKSFAMKEIRILEDKNASSSYPLSFYFYGDLPFSEGELTTPVRLAVLINDSGKVSHIHLMFTDFNSKEDILFKEVKF